MKSIRNGYYEYCGNIYSDRDLIAELMFLKNDYKDPIVFNFHDEFFSKLDWSKEPVESLDELYRARAQQIRDTYKRVMLCYSGGSDSQFILETFLNNNIFIDEIYTVNWDKATNKLDKTQLMKDESAKFVLEYDFNVVPNLKRVSQLSPNTKINVLDTSEYLFNDINSSKFEMLGMQQTPFATRGLISPVPRSWHKTLWTELGKRISDTNSCLITGFEKPNLFIDKSNKVWFAFSDAGYNYEKYLNKSIVDHSINIEFFFWSPECPLLPRKQSHVMLKEFRRNPSLLQTYKETRSSASYDETNKKLGHSAWYDFEQHITPIIYPSLKLNYIPGKPKLLGPEFKLMAAYHGFQDKIVSALKEHYTFKRNRFKNVKYDYFQKVIHTRKYYIGQL